MRQSTKNRKLILFSALVLLVVGYAVYDFQSEKQSAKEKEEQAVILSVPKEHIASFTLKNTSGEITATRKPEGWWIESPKQELADQGAVAEFLEFVTSEKSNDGLTDGVIKWSIYGLENPLGTVVIKDNSQNQFQISVGTRNNFEGQTYLRRNQEQKILLASSAWKTEIEKKLFDFRDKRILRFPGVEVRKISFQSKKNRFDLNLEQDEWVSPQLKGKKLDQNKVREILTVLQSMQAIEFLSEGTPKPDQVKALGLNDPMATLTLHRKDGKTWTAKVFESPQKVSSILTSDPILLSKIAPSSASTLASYDVNNLRDRAEPFDFNKNEISRIEFKTPLKSGTLEKKGKWILSGHEQESVNNVGVDAFLSILRNLQVSQFKGAGELKKIERTIKLFSPEGALIFEMNIGPSVKEKENVFYEIKTSKHPEVIWLKEADINSLNMQNIFVTEKSPEKKEEK